MQKARSIIRMHNQRGRNEATHGAIGIVTIAIKRGEQEFFLGFATSTEVICF